MAGEFDKRTEADGTIIWMCTKCRLEIANLTKPRRHIYHQNGEDLRATNSTTPASTPTDSSINSTPQNSRTPMNVPTPGFHPPYQNRPWDQIMHHQQQQMQIFQEQQAQIIRT